MPELEDEQVPELPGAIADSFPMLEESAPHGLPIEVPSLNRPRFEQDFQKRVIVSKPVHQRHGKSLLSTVQDVAWNPNALRQFFQDVFRLPTTQLPSRRQFGSPFGEAMIK